MFRRTLLLAIATVLTTIPAQAQRAVEKFVRQTFIHGVPYNEASRFGSEDIPILLSMLENPNEEPYWVNIVAVLGNIGGEAAATSLISFIEDGPKGALSHFSYKAKSGAIMSLGYVVNKAKDRRALEYLKEGLEMETWVKRRLPWRAVHFSSPAEQRAQLVKLSLMGLGLAGTVESAAAINAFKQKEGPSSPYASTIEQVLQAHAQISAKGLTGYYP